MKDSKCELCGEPMPVGEEMFKYHGYSGDCPKPPLAPLPQPDPDGWNAAVKACIAKCEPANHPLLAAVVKAMREMLKPAESAAPPTREGEK